MVITILCILFAAARVLVQCYMTGLIKAKVMKVFNKI